MNSKTIKTLAGSAPLALALALGGCVTGTVNPGIDTIHQPVVQRTDYTLDLQMGGERGLASGEARRLSTWFESLELGYGDRVSIDDPSGYGSDARDAVAAMTARYGLLLNEGAPMTTGSVPSGSVRVVVSRMTASVPGCPDWSRPSHPEFEGSTASNFGCAASTNLAAMVANPEDLIQGQAGTGGPDAQTVSKAIKVFRDRIPTGVGEVKKETTKGE